MCGKDRISDDEFSCASSVASVVSVQAHLKSAEIRARVQAKEANSQKEKELHQELLDLKRQENEMKKY